MARKIFALALALAAAAVLWLLPAGQARGQNSFGASLQSCTNTESTLLPFHPNRTRAVLLNVGRQDVWIHGTTGSTAGGYVLHAAAIPTQAHALVVYGRGRIVCSTDATQLSDTVHVRVWAEYN